MTNTIKAVNKTTGEVLLMTAEAAAAIKAKAEASKAVIDFEAITAAAAAKIKAAKIKAAEAEAEAKAAAEAAEAEAAAEVKKAAALRNKKGEAIIKLRYAIDEIAEGLEAAKINLGVILDEAKAIKSEEVIRPEAIAAAAEALKAYIVHMTAAKAKAAEALIIEGGSLANTTKVTKLKKLFAEVEGIKTAAEEAAAIIRGAKNEALRPLTKSEINEEKKKAIAEALEANNGNTSREAFWKLFINCKFAVKPTKANYLAAFGKEDGSVYYANINSLFDSFLNSLLALRCAFGEAEAYKEAEAEAYKIFKDICNKLHLVNLNNCGIASNLMHTLAARGYNWRIVYNEKKEAHIIAAAKSNNVIMFEVFAEITSPEAIAAAIATREAKKAKRLEKAKAKAAKK